MKRIYTLLLSISIFVSAFGGHPFVGIEGAYAPQRYWHTAIEIFNIGANAGYELEFGKVFIAPQIAVGYENTKHEYGAPGGPTLIGHSNDFYASLAFNFGVKIYKGFAIYTAPMVKYTSFDAQKSYHWGMYWNFGVSYSFSRFKVFCSYNQQVTKMYIYSRLNPICAGIQFYL